MLIPAQWEDGHLVIYLPVRIHLVPKDTDKHFLEKLTRREKEVFELLLLGKSNKEIAVKLYLSENTVKFHVRKLLNKGHESTRGALAGKFTTRAIATLEETK